MKSKNRDKRGPGYHVSPIPRGVLGRSSKILEEVLELIDAEKQESKVMVAIELSDLVGAIQAYLCKELPSLTLADLTKMAFITKRAFTNGHRETKQ